MVAFYFLSAYRCWNSFHSSFSVCKFPSSLKSSA